MTKVFVRNMKRDYVQALVLLLFLLPLFFQLSGSIFTAKDLNFDSEGSLFLIPLPIASIFCFIGIALLLRLEKKHFGMGFVFSTFILMMFSTIVTTGDVQKTELAKFILLIQFILPMFAVVLGSLYLAPKSDYLRLEALILYVLLLVVPLEVISTIIRGTGILNPYLYIFSLYQHLQYLPVVFVGLYFLTVTALYENKKLRYLVLFLAPWMGIYLSASLSMLAIILALLATFLSSWFLYKNGKKRYILILLILLWASFTLYYPSVMGTGTYALKYSQTLQPQDIKINKTVEGELTSKKQQKSERQQERRQQQQEMYKQLTETLPDNKFFALLPNNLKERFYYWKFHVEGILESPIIFVFGHKNRPDRNAYPSAHNYYLDLIYHFGVISFIPFIYLIFITIRNSWKIVKARVLTPNLAMLITLVGFFVFADNSLKVSFRQPYPGMIMFFLWGVLLTSLSKLEDNKDRHS